MRFLRGFENMKVSVWMCNFCGDEIPCIMPRIVGNRVREVARFGCVGWKDEICSCPYSEGEAADFKLTEIEASELIHYFSNQCEHYYLAQMCKGRGGICPKECDGNIRVCEKNVGVQRSIRSK